MFVRGGEGSVLYKNMVTLCVLWSCLGMFRDVIYHDFTSLIRNSWWIEWIGEIAHRQYSVVAFFYLLQ
jgi:hypothetical protein